MSTKTQNQPRLNRKLAIKIARDVLAQLRLNRYKAEQGRYCTIDEDSLTDETDVWGGTSETAVRNAKRQSFKTAFKANKAIQCNVCALGSLFTSFVHLNNVFTVGQVIQPQFSRMFGALEAAFPIRDLLLMEYVFEEGNNGILRGKVRDPESNYDNVQSKVRFRNARMTFDRNELSRARNYGQRYSYDDDQRLRLIMLNVVRNKGQFILPRDV